MIQITYYVPESAHEKLKQKLFKAGAGKLGNYDQCCWYTLGEGQFRPLTGSSPNLGKINQLHQLQEYKVEMVCEEKYLKAVVKTLLKHHPYEQPAYMLIDASQTIKYLIDK